MDIVLTARRSASTWGASTKHPTVGPCPSLHELLNPTTPSCRLLPISCSRHPRKKFAVPIVLCYDLLHSTFVLCALCRGLVHSIDSPLIASGIAEKMKERRLPHCCQTNRGRSPLLTWHSRLVTHHVLFVIVVVTWYMPWCSRCRADDRILAINGDGDGESLRPGCEVNVELLITCTYLII